MCNDVNFKDIVGKSDNLSEVMQHMVDNNHLSEERAFEIKNQLTGEFNEGKVRDESVLDRLLFLIGGIDFPHDVGILKRNIDSGLNLCPYCFQITGNNNKSCPVCGYDLTCGVEPDFSDAKIFDSTHEFNMDSIDNMLMEHLKYSAYTYSGINSKKPGINCYNYGFINGEHICDSEKYCPSYDIDLFNAITDLDETGNIDNFLLYSCLSKDEIADILIEKGFITESHEITEKGYRYVGENEWMSFYMDYIPLFDFNEFRQYYESSDGDIGNIAVDFLDKHYDLARKTKDFSRFIDVLSAKGHIYDYLGEYDTSLSYELKVFIYNLNPPYFGDFSYSFHDPLNEYNIDTLYNFRLTYTMDSIKILFNRAWEETEFDTVHVPKFRAWKTLVNLFGGSDVKKTSLMIAKMYYPNA